MGQKINPVGLRLQINRTWDSRWFAKSREYSPTRTYFGHAADKKAKRK